MALADDKDSFASLFERAPGTPLRRRFRTGERVEVEVVAIGRDAVFVDMGAKQEGFFELAEMLGEDGRVAVAVGARVAAVVAGVQESTGQVRLSPVFVRQAAVREDSELGVVIPRASSAPLMVEGAQVQGKVTGVERYGVFVQIQGTSGRGGRGLVPSAETGTPRGADLKKHFSVGQDVSAKILNIAEDGKIRLSFTALQGDSERKDFEQYTRAGGAEGAEATQGSKGGKGGDAKDKPKSIRGFGTLGDLMAKARK